MKETRVLSKKDRLIDLYEEMEENKEEDIEFDPEDFED